MKKTILTFLYFSLTALLIIAPALYNRYPLIYSDSGTYMATSFTLIPPLEKPIGYGFFIRIVTWQSTMWTVVFFQGLIGSYLIFKVLSMLFTFEKKKMYSLHFSIVLLLMLFSSLGWYTSQIMPDIFTSFLILTIFIFIREAVLGWKSYIFYLFLFFVFTVSHYSHLFISLLEIMILFSYYLIKYKRDISRTILRRISFLFIIWIASLQFLMIDNYSHGIGYVLNPVSNLFLTARFSETGLLKKYLDDNCAHINCYLCPYKDSLPDQSWKFLWAPYSPHVKSKMTCQQANEEYAPIVKGILTSPKYLKFFVWDGIKGTLQGLFQVYIGCGLGPYGVNSAPYFPIKAYLSNDELNEFLNSEQSCGSWNFNFFNTLNYLILSISLLILFISINNNLITPTLKLFIAVISLGIFLNSAITSSLSAPDSRYGARVTWLIVFAALCCLAQVLPKIIRPYRVAVKE